MDATLILIDSDAELARARTLVDQLWNSDNPADVARLEAQVRLIAAYEEKQWPRRSSSVADLIRHLMDQHGLTRADLVPLLGTPSRVSEVMRGKKGLSMAVVQRLRARFRVPADLLLPPPKKASVVPTLHEAGGGLIYNLSAVISARKCPSSTRLGPESGSEIQGAEPRAYQVRNCRRKAPFGGRFRFSPPGSLREVHRHPCGV